MTNSAREAPARRRMLDVALDLFHQKGISATSVDEILEKSGTGKSQFYHYFESKDGLVRAVVDHFEGMLARREVGQQYEVRSFRELKKWFQFFVEHQRMTGAGRHCPMATIASGLRDDQEDIRADIERIVLDSRKVLDRYFTGLAAENKLPPRTRPEELADFCYSIMQGGLIVSRVRRDVTPFENAVKHAMTYIRSLLPPGER